MIKNLSNWSRYFITGGFWLFSGYVFTTLRVLVVGIVLIRFFTKEDVGLYAFVQSIIGIAAILSLPGAGVAISQSAATKNEGAYRYLIKTQFLMSLIGSFVLIVAGVHDYLIGNHVYLYWYMALALVYPVYNAASNYQYFLVGKSDFRQRGLIEILRNVILLPLLLITIFMSKSIWWYLLAVYTVQAIFDSVVTFKILRNIPNKAGNQETFQFAFKLSLADILTNLKTQLQAFLSRIMLGLEITANLNVSLVTSDQISALTKIISVVSFPRTREIKSTKKSRIFFVSILFSAIVCIAGLTILVLPYMIPLVFGYKYADSILIAQLFVVVAGFKSINYVLLKFEQFDKILKGTFVLSAVSPSIEIVLMILLIPFLGLKGIVLSRMIGETINLVYLLPIFILRGDFGLGKNKKIAYRI